MVNRDHGPVDPLFEEALKDAALILDSMLNPSFKEKKENGFIVLMFPINKEGRISYMSNCRRKDCIVALKEFLAVMEGRLFTTDTKQ